MKILGVDFGLRRIGFAQSDGIYASPFKITEVSSLKDSLQKIINESVGFDKVIIGRPDGIIGKKVDKIVKALRQKKINVETADENLSSKKASANMIEIGIKKKKRKLNDSFAASIILQEYLDNL
jgi:putative transcription antitermination factor YqgF